MKMLTLLAIVLGVSLFGCKGEEPKATAAPVTVTPSKDLFSVWTSENNSFILDLSNITFTSSGIFQLRLANGDTCTCMLAVGGTQTRGAIILSSCFNLDTSPADTSCDPLNGSSNFTKTDTTLTLCDAGGCSSFY